MNADELKRLGELGVATVYEASGREGLIDVPLIQLLPGTRVAGPALTVLCGQDDNLMVHAAIEHIQADDPRGPRVMQTLAAHQVLAGDHPLQVVGDPPFLVHFRLLVHVGSCQVTLCLHLADLAVGKGQEEEIGVGVLHLTADASAVPLGVGYRQQDPVDPLDELHGCGELAVRLQWHRLAVDLNAVAGVGEAGDNQLRFSQAHPFWRQFHRQVRDRLHHNDQVPLLIPVGNADLQVGNPAVAVRIACQQAEDVPSRLQAQFRGEAPVWTGRQRRAVSRVR